MADISKENLDQYEGMVTKALERLTRWAFPDSQLERLDQFTWQLWHTADNMKKYIDVSVTLQMKRGKPDSYLIADSIQPQLASLTREDLDDKLRMAICSLGE